MDKNRMISYGDAIYEACVEEMKKDRSVIVYGLGVDDPKGHYGTTKNLHKEFGSDRCFDIPLSEDAMTGMGIGAALAGLRPIYVHQRMDFLMLCMNQIVNMASKMNYLSSSNSSVPLVIRAAIGRSWGQGAQHSQAFHSFFMHIPGIKIVAPTTPHDAKGILVSSIRDNNPVIFMEHRMLYENQGYVPTHNYAEELGKGRVIREGTDITLVGVSYTVVDCLRAAELLSTIGISAEVIDPVSLYPLDYNLIRKSSEKTKKLIVVDNGWLTCSFASEVISDIAINLENVKCRKIGYADSPCPTTKNLEENFYPDPIKIAIEANKICNIKRDWKPEEITNIEVDSFKGPF